MTDVQAVIDQQNDRVQRWIGECYDRVALSIAHFAGHRFYFRCGGRLIELTATGKACPTFVLQQKWAWEQ